jgi:mRNA interferase RelE/StbE
MGHRLERAKLPNPAVEVFAHGVDSLLWAAGVRVALYVMGCDHGHNPIDRRKQFSGHAKARPVAWRVIVSASIAPPAWPILLLSRPHGVPSCAHDIVSASAGWARRPSRGGCGRIGRRPTRSARVRRGTGRHGPRRRHGLRKGAQRRAAPSDSHRGSPASRSQVPAVPHAHVEGRHIFADRSPRRIHTHLASLRPCFGSPTRGQQDQAQLQLHCPLTVSRPSLARPPEKAATAAVESVYGSLAATPRRVGTPLQFGLAGLHSAWRGDYWVIYRIDDDSRTVMVMAIKYRSDVYQPRQL